MTSRTDQYASVRITRWSITTWSLSSSRPLTLAQSVGSISNFSSPTSRFLSSSGSFPLPSSEGFSQEKLEPITGIPVGNQQLAIYNNDADLQPVKVLDDDHRPLGFYSPADFQVLKVRVQPSRSMHPYIVNYTGGRH